MSPEQLPTPNILNKLVKDDLSLLSALLDEHYVLSDDPFIDNSFESDSPRGKMMTQIVEAVAIFSGSVTEEHRQLAHRAAHFAVTVARLEVWKIEEERYTATYLKNTILEFQASGVRGIAERIDEDTAAYMKNNPALELLVESFVPCIADTGRERQICQSVMRMIFMMIDLDMTRRGAEEELAQQLHAELEAWDGVIDEDLL